MNEFAQNKMRGNNVKLLTSAGGQTSEKITNGED